MNEKEKQQIKDYVIGTMKLSYPDMRKNEIDLFLEDLDAIIEGRDIPHTKEDIERRLKLLKDMEKYYKVTILDKDKGFFIISLKSC